MEMDDASIEKQIKETINRLTACFLGDLESRYKLPDKSDGLPSTFQTLLPELKTDLYKLSAHGDHHQICVQLELNTTKIKAVCDRLATKSTPYPDWAFLGFIKEKVFNGGNIKKYGSLEELSSVADMNTQTSGPIFTPIKELIPHSALFLIAFDTDEKFRVEADKLAALRIPQSPKIDDITELKEKLIALMDIKSRGDRKQSAHPQSTPPLDKRAKRDMVITEYKETVEWINCNVPEEDRAGQIQGAAMKMREALWALNR